VAHLGRNGVETRTDLESRCPMLAKSVVIGSLLKRRAHAGCRFRPSPRTSTSNHCRPAPRVCSFLRANQFGERFHNALWPRRNNAMSADSARLSYLVGSAQRLLKFSNFPSKRTKGARTYSRRGRFVLKIVRRRLLYARIDNAEMPSNPPRRRARRRPWGQPLIREQCTTVRFCDKVRNWKSRRLSGSIRRGARLVTRGTSERS
jgi:hypothetical protein